jgi:nicotinamide riboside kinase
MAQACRDGCALVFCDTCPLLTALYSDYYFSDPSLLEPAHALHTRYALTLLLAPDLPWVADGAQRDGVAVQSAIHARLLREFQALRFPYVGVSGQGSHRVQTAVAAVNSLTG